MRPVIAAALVLLLAVFLCPLILLGGEGDREPGDPAPTATLPIHQTVTIPAGGTEDRKTLVRVKRGEGQVETMDMADYLWGVVAAEMPASFEPEALKAQAVTARTYALYKMAHGPAAAHPEADVCTDITCCQACTDRETALRGWEEEGPVWAGRITAAVSATDGQTLRYGGELIDAVFFSSAAGTTRDAVEVWGAEVPYLKAVDSPEGPEVPNYRTTVTVAPEEFRAALTALFPEIDLSEPPGAWLGEDADPLPIGGVKVGKTVLRSLFGLRSASFTARAGKEGVTFSVTGYGHGVGMSQYGANAMARAGADYREILTHYYTGAVLAEG